MVSAYTGKIERDISFGFVFFFNEIFGILRVRLRLMGLSDPNISNRPMLVDSIRTFSTAG